MSNQQFQRPLIRDPQTGRTREIRNTDLMAGVKETMDALAGDGVEIPRFLNGGQGAPAQSPGFLNIYAKGDVLYGRKDDGTELRLSPLKIAYLSTVSDANGNWQVNITGFSQVMSVIPVVVFDTAQLTQQKLVSINQITNTLARGKVMDSNTITTLLLGSADGLQFSGPGFPVRVRVEGIE